MRTFYIFVSIFVVVAFATFELVAGICCTPEHWYNDGCNTCTCNGNGDFYSCTKMLCNDNPIKCVVGEECITTGRKRPCLTGHEYFDGCNKCHCTNGAYACTKIGCPSNPVKCCYK